MSNSKRSLYGSSRSRYFKEPKQEKRLSFKKRPQKVRIRKKYAATIIKQIALGSWALIKMAFFAGVVGWLAILGWKFWNSSPLLKVAEVQFNAEVPPGLKVRLDIRPGQNIFSFRTSKLEDIFLGKFPELEKLGISRTINREIRVFGTYRVPVAVIQSKKGLYGIEEGGTLFPIFSHNTPQFNLPVIKDINLSDPRLKSWAQALQKIKIKKPEFYSVIFRLETDKIHATKMTLRNEVVVWWGELKLENAEERVHNIESLMKRYRPKGSNATLTIITRDRIVMDKNWEKKIGKT